jgi:hypothetical protein
MESPKKPPTAHSGFPPLPFLETARRSFDTVAECSSDVLKWMEENFDEI